MEEEVSVSEMGQVFECPYMGGQLHLPLDIASMYLVKVIKVSTNFHFVGNWLDLYPKFFFIFFDLDDSEVYMFHG